MYKQGTNTNRDVEAEEVTSLIGLGHGVWGRSQQTMGGGGVGALPGLEALSCVSKSNINQQSANRDVEVG